MAFAGIPVDHDNIANIKEFFVTYNKLTELCFNRCSTNFDHRDLTSQEAHCFEGCFSKFVGSSEVIMHTFAEIQTKKQQQMMQEAAKQQNSDSSGTGQPSTNNPQGTS